MLFREFCKNVSYEAEIGELKHENNRYTPYRGFHISILLSLFNLRILFYNPPQSVLHH